MQGRLYRSQDVQARIRGGAYKPQSLQPLGPFKTFWTKTAPRVPRPQFDHLCNSSYLSHIFPLQIQICVSEFLPLSLGDDLQTCKVQGSLRRRETHNYFVDNNILFLFVLFAPTFLLIFDRNLFMSTTTLLVGCFSFGLSWCLKSRITRSNLTMVSSSQGNVESIMACRSRDSSNPATKKD